MYLEINTKGHVPDLCFSQTKKRERERGQKKGVDMSCDDEMTKSQSVSRVASVVLHIKCHPVSDNGTIERRYTMECPHC